MPDVMHAGLFYTGETALMWREFQATGSSDGF